MSPGTVLQRGGWTEYWNPPDLSSPGSEGFVSDDVTWCCDDVMWCCDDVTWCCDDVTWGLLGVIFIS